MNITIMEQPRQLCRNSSYPIMKEEKFDYKKEVDNYFTKKYSQLESTTNKIILKRGRDVEASNVIGAAYIYVLESESKVKAFAALHKKSIEHILYSFTLQFINQTLIWSSSKLLKEDNRLFEKIERLADQEITGYYKITNPIYTEEFILSFYESLDRLDAICFRVYYYEGVDNAVDFAKHFNISKSSAYASINKLKHLLKQYILLKQII